jgi:hypothetical protein
MGVASVIYAPTDEDRRIYAGMSVVIVTPCGGYSNPFRFTKSLANLISYSWRHGLRVEAFGGTERMVVHWARNDLAKQVKDRIDENTGEKYTHVLWLDDDHVFNPDLLCYLARNGDKDVVSALYFGRTQPLPVAYVKDYNEDKYKHFPLIWPPSQLCEVDAIGFGACLMRRDVLDRVPEPYFRFNECGEDIYFCVHAKEKGVKIWLDGSYQLGHIGDPHIVIREDYERYVKEHEKEWGPRIKVALGGKNG